MLWRVVSYDEKTAKPLCQDKVTGGVQQLPQTPESLAADRAYALFCWIRLNARRLCYLGRCLGDTVLPHCQVGADSSYVVYLL